MRIAFRIAAALLVLAALALGALFLLLPRLLSSDAAARHLQAAARDAIGRDVVWQDLGVGLLPPRVVMRGFEVIDPEGRPEVGFRAGRIDLEIAWLPLLARHVVVDSLVLEGIELRLLRTESGFMLPVDLAREAEPSETAAPPTPPDEGGFVLAVRSFRIAEGHLRLEDRSVSPTAIWEVNELDAKLSATALDAPIELALTGALETGGTFRADGSVLLAGPVSLHLALQDVALLPLAPYLGDLKLAGRASGDADLTGRAGVPESITAALKLSDGIVALDDLRAAGPLSVSLSVEGLDAPQGRFELDARRAELVYGDAFRKPPGTEAKATGTFRSEPDGDLRFDIERMKIKNASGSGNASLGKSFRARGSLASFDLTGWGELIAALAAYQPRGRVALPQGEFASPPGALHGRVQIDQLQLNPPERAPVTVDGALVARGNRLESEALTLVSAGQAVPVELAVTNLLGGTVATETPRYRLRTGLSDTEANDLLTAFAALPDTLYGVVSLRADLTGPVGGTSPPLEAMSGSVELRVEPGRLRSVSLLRGVFDQLGTLGDAALLLGALQGGSTLQRFYGDDFEELSGTFEIASGRARTDNLRVLYRDYRVDLRGALGLVDQSLDFSGSLTIDPQIGAALTPGDAASNGRSGRPKVIPLAGVTGTLAQPRIRITQEAALQFAASVQGDPELRERRGKLEKKIDEQLGAGSGKQVMDALGGLLGLPVQAPPSPESEP